jgi:hypothetical protein
VRLQLINLGPAQACGIDDLREPQHTDRVSQRWKVLVAALAYACLRALLRRLIQPISLGGAASAAES